MWKRLRSLSGGAFPDRPAGETADGVSGTERGGDKPWEKLACTRRGWAAVVGHGASTNVPAWNLRPLCVALSRRVLPAPVCSFAAVVCGYGLSRAAGSRQLGAAP